MTDKLLITGSNGMFATDLAKAAQEAGYDVVGLPHQRMDVTQPAQVREAFEGIRPTLVVNTPDLGVDPCEERPEDGYRVNTWAAEVVGRQCERVGATLVHLSTCGVFGDEVKSYSEYDPVVLKTQYARSKYLGEQAAARSCRRTFVVRPGWLYGGPTDHRKNFVYQRYLQARKEPVLRSASDKHGSPTSTMEMAGKILELVRTEEYGLYHVTNEGGCSRYDYVKAIVDAFGLTTPVEPVDSSAFPRLASVPDCEILDNLNVRLVGLSPMEPWQEAIERYVRTLADAG
jgi:dTDP-4-dehydrorhamnose reductase